jgi:hypothetical protein
MNREVHVRFCERLGVKFPRSTHHRLHWQLDVSFREDECRICAENAAENLVVVRHIALNLLRSVKGLRGGLEAKRGQAAWSDAMREKILQAGLK